MAYRLGPGLSYCEVDGRLVFLDVAKDRYFQLSGRMAAAMQDVSAGREPDPAALQGLLARQLLVVTPGPSHLPSGHGLPPMPEHSALEAGTRAEGGASALLEVACLVAAARFQLKARRLDAVLSALMDARDRGLAAAPRAWPAAAGTDPLLEACARFHRARALVPIEPCCLPDSIALVRFLARRGLRAGITFGVTLDPFAAHCWAQAGRWVLNDSVGNALAHTPIRSV